MEPTIRRTKIISGITVPAFIHNGCYFFTDLEVYEDGFVYCWENTDLQQFRKKLESGWVTPAPPNGEISIHHLGDFTIEKAKWIHDISSFYKYVENKIEELKNREQVDFFESPDRYFNKEYFREDKTTASKYWKKTVKGDHSYFFYKTEDKGWDVYYLIDLYVYADRSITFGLVPKETEITFEQLDEYIAQEIIVTRPPDGSCVVIDGLGSFTVTGDIWHEDVIEKRKELDDMVSQLNGEETSSDRCVAIYEKYVENSGEELREQLRIAYENVPEHLRRYMLGDMDMKDGPVRRIIYGKK